MNLHGWTKTAAFYNSSVYYTDMSNYGNESDITYVTSHGSKNGAILLQNYADTLSDSSLTSYIRSNHVGGNGYLRGNVSGPGTDGAGGDAEWFIFATCNALYDDNWAKGVAKGVHHLLGYRDLSYEGTDTKIVDEFFWYSSEYASPYTVWSSWITANRTYSLYNWAIIGHSNNKNDYLPGIKTGVTADQSSNSDVYRWQDSGGSSITSTSLSSYAKSVNDISGNIPDDEIDKLSDKYLYTIKTKREKIDISKIGAGLLGDGYKTDLKARYMSSPNGSIRLFDDDSFVYSREIKTDKIDLTQDKVKQQVEEFINNNGGMRNDLELAAVVPSIAEGEAGNQIVIGYTFQYKQKYNDTIIDGNFANGVTVSYDADGVNFYMRDVKDLTSKNKNLKQQKVKQPKDIINKAKNVENTPIKSDEAPDYKNISFVYYSYPFNANKNELIPAYKLSINDTNALFFDAVTGELLDGAKELLKNKPRLPEPNEYINKDNYEVTQYSDEQ